MRERLLNSIRLGLQVQQRGELRLPTCPSMIDDKFPGGGLCHLEPMIVLHHGQRQVNSSSHPGRGPDARILDEDAVWKQP